MSEEIKEEINEGATPENESTKKKCCSKLKEIIDSKEVNDLLFITFGSFLGASLALCFYHTFAQPKYPPAPIIQPPCHHMMPYEYGQFEEHEDFYEEFEHPGFHKKEFKNHKGETHKEHKRTHDNAPFDKEYKD